MDKMPQAAAPHLADPPDAAPQAVKPQGFFRRRRKVLGIVLLSLLVVGASVGGYFIWLESSYQTEEAEQVMAQALEHLESAHREADNVIDALKKVDRLTNARSDAEREATREQIAVIQGEISSGKAAAAAVNAEIVAFESSLDTAQVFKLKDEYRSYLAMRRDSSLKMREFIDSVNQSLAVLEQLANYHTATLDLLIKYDTLEFSLDAQIFHDQAVQLKSDVLAFNASDEELIKSGVLPAKLNELEQFYVGCADRMIVLSDTVLADDFPAFEIATTDLESACSEARIDENDAESYRLWDVAWNDFFDDAIDEALEKNGNAERSRDDADDFSQYAV